MPNLRLLRYRIKKFDFSFENAEKMLLTFELNPSMNFDHEKCELDIQIKIDGKEGERNALKLVLDIIGEFQAEDLDENEMKKWCKAKGAYDLIQVARSVVLSFTSQAGMNPGLIIPPINLDKMFEEKSKKKK